MHINVEHQSLVKILELVARVSTKHLTLPILQCVLLEVKEGILYLRGTNLEIGIEGTLEVTEKEPGTVSVSAATLLQTVSLIDHKTVTLRTEGDILIVETPTSKSSLHTVASDEFPHIPRVEGEGQRVNGKVFSHGIKTAAFAASQSSIKPELGSVYIFQKKEHSLTFVATDSFRLVEKILPQQNIVLDHSVLVPFKNALELARVCDLEEDEPTLRISENQCALEFKHIYITSRLTSGSFPDYEQIIPKEYVTHTTLLTADFVSALRRTNIFLNKFMQLTVQVEKDTLTLISKGDAGTTTETVKATTDGDPITLNFNQRYIQEILPMIVDDSITIHFAGIGRPIVIESVHDRSLRYLVMPMNK